VNTASSPESLASYRKCVEKLQCNWAEFQQKRKQRLQPHPLMGGTPERVVENILEDLFTGVLDWGMCDVLLQLDGADIVLAEHGIKRLIVEAKRPESLAWNRRAVEKALDQALRYAAEQKVKCVAVSDGVMIYAADVLEGGIRDRVFVSLDSAETPLDLWWVSVQGIWRDRESSAGAELRLLPEIPVSSEAEESAAPVNTELLHPKYARPARCFAYVGSYADPRTWKLPYLLADGTTDASRLPKAIQSILTNYRGAKVSGIPEAAIPVVLQRLAAAATNAGHMPPANANPARVYRQLAEALGQLGMAGSSQRPTNSA
jgi:hypothetical protein